MRHLVEIKIGLRFFKKMGMKRNIVLEYSFFVQKYFRISFDLIFITQWKLLKSC